MLSLVERWLKRAVGREVRKARLHRKLSQAEAAQRCGVNRGHFCEIESGKSDPKFSTLMKISFALSDSQHSLIHSLTKMVFEKINPGAK